MINCPTESQDVPGHYSSSPFTKRYLAINLRDFNWKTPILFKLCTNCVVTDQKTNEMDIARTIDNKKNPKP